MISPEDTVPGVGTVDDFVEGARPVLVHRARRCQELPRMEHPEALSRSCHHGPARPHGIRLQRADRRAGGNAENRDPRGTDKGVPARRTPLISFRLCRARPAPRAFPRSLLPGSLGGHPEVSYGIRRTVACVECTRRHRNHIDHYPRSAPPPQVLMEGVPASWASVPRHGIR